MADSSLLECGVRSTLQDITTQPLHLAKVALSALGLIAHVHSCCLYKAANAFRSVMCTL